MGLVINVEKSANENDLIKPCHMLDRGNEDKIFQMYDDGLAQETIFINCGTNEKSLVSIWFDDERECFRLSTDDLKSLRQYNPHIKVKDVTDRINIQIQIKN